MYLILFNPMFYLALYRHANGDGNTFRFPCKLVGQVLALMEPNGENDDVDAFIASAKRMKG